MLHEPATFPDYAPPKQEEPKTQVEKQFDSIREAVEEVITIHHEFFPQREQLLAEDLVMLTRNNQRVVISYAGEIAGDTSLAYETLDALLVQFDMFALFRQPLQQAGNNQYIIHIAQARLRPEKQRFPLTNIVLMIATIISVFITGMTIAIGEINLTDTALAEQLVQNGLRELWRGYPYALSIMLILGSHEFAHYWMMRRHKVEATLPYFLPLPFISPFGTLGAAIILKGPIRNRKHLFDIGASGPIVGIIFAIPILIIGLATSVVMAPEGGMLEGNSILYALSKIAVFGEFLPNDEVDVLLNQLAWAGWTGLFVTALNLIPIGQLDGGHIIYSLIGRNARKLYIPLIGMLLGLILFVSSVWAFLFLLMLIFGRFYAVPLDAITPLDPKRRNFAVGMLVLFLLIFIPIPLAEQGQPNGFFSGQVASTIHLTVGLIVVQKLWHHFRFYRAGKR